MKAWYAFGLATLFVSVMMMASFGWLSPNRSRAGRSNGNYVSSGWVDLTVRSIAQKKDWFEQQRKAKETLKDKGRIVVFKFRGQTKPIWASRIESALKDSDVSGVVMWIESGGGYVYEAKLLGHYVDLFKAVYKKPIYVYSEVALYSGAYWTAVAADSIFVAPSGGVGSIGVRSQRVDATAADSMAGYRVYTFTSGDMKAAGDPHTKMSPKERGSREASIDQIYRDFLWQVWSNRSGAFLNSPAMNGQVSDTLAAKQMLQKMANGSTFNAYVAKRYGFIDDVLWFDELVNLLELRGYKVVDRNGKPVGLLGN